MFHITQLLILHLFNKSFKLEIKSRQNYMFYYKKKNKYNIILHFIFATT